MPLHKKRRGKFNRELLPTPITVLNQFGINPGKPFIEASVDLGAWRSYT